MSNPIRVVPPRRTKAEARIALAEKAKQFRDQVEACSKYRETNFILWPEMWRAYQEADPLNWQSCRLATAERHQVPERPGIYSLIVQPDIAGHPFLSYMMYVGKATSLQERFENYAGTEHDYVIRPRVHMLLNKYPDNLLFCFAELPEGRVRQVEQALYTAVLPPYNSQIEGEVGKIRKAVL